MSLDHSLSDRMRTHATCVRLNLVEDRTTTEQLNAGADRPARTHACPTYARPLYVLRNGTFLRSLELGVNDVVQQ